MMDLLKQAHLEEPCPKCAAVSGEKCFAPSGKPLSKPHADRIHNGNILFEERLLSGYYKEEQQNA